MNYFRVCFFVPFILVIAGCSGVHTINAEFPTPLVKPIERSAYLSITPEFSDYRFKEEEEDRDNITIILGQAHTNLFTSVINSLFSEAGVSTEASDITLIPELNTFQYALPNETGSGFYEIWLRYRLQALKPDGSEIADWLITGYGRAAYGGPFSLAGTGMNEAAEEALRDVGTQLALGFTQQADIESWLNTEEP